MENNIRVARILMALCWLHGVFAAIGLFAVVDAIQRGVLSEVFTLSLGICAIFVALTALHFFTARGARARQRWANVTSNVLGATMLLLFPLGTLIGAALLYYGNWTPKRKYSHNLTDGWPTQSESGNNS